MTDSNRVEIFVDVLRDGLDRCVQFILDFEHVMLVILSDEIDGNTEMTEPARTTNPVEVGVGGAREVEVDDHVDGQDIDSSGEEIRADETSGLSIAEVVVNPTASHKSLEITYLFLSFCIIRE